jgi:hypothetical protein
MPFLPPFDKSYHLVHDAATAAVVHGGIVRDVHSVIERIRPGIVRRQPESQTV